MTQGKANAPGHAKDPRRPPSGAPGPGHPRPGPSGGETQPGSQDGGSSGGLAGGVDDGRRRTWTSWILMRYTSTDIGARPIPNGDVFWLSPDVWVESSDIFGNAVAGQPNFVHARILNLGKALARPTRVDFYWGDPSVGLGPAQMSQPGQHIGTEWVEVAARRTVDVRCNTPWVPQFVNGGHECLMVNCSAPLLGDAITQPFEPTLDRHVGQRNVTVVQSSAGEIVHFRVAVTNLIHEAAQVTLASRIEQVTVTYSDALAPRDLVNLVAAYVRGAATASVDSTHLPNEPRAGAVPARGPVLRDASAGRSAPHVHARLSAESKVIPSAGARVDLDRLRRGAGLVRSSGSHLGNVHTLEVLAMRALEQRRAELELKIPADARPGEFIVFHLTEAVEGLVLGGYTIVVRVTSRGAAR
jgi:hypothetical protein